MRNRSAYRGVPVAGMAAVGVLLGHWLAYTVAFPVGADRGHVLAATGHAYWLTAVRVSVVLAVVGLAAVAGRLARTDGKPSAGESFSAMARRLASAQVAAFTAMELIERVVTRAPLAHLFDHEVFFLGLAAQVVVACAGALVLLWFGRTAVAVVRALRGDPGIRLRPQPAFVRPDPALGRLLLALAGAAGVRGPPPR